jgi:hypothetical protein
MKQEIHHEKDLHHQDMLKDKALLEKDKLSDAGMLEKDKLREPGLMGADIKAGMPAASAEELHHRDVDIKKPIIEKIYEKPVVIRHQDQAVRKDLYEIQTIEKHELPTDARTHVEQPIVKEIHQDVIHEHHKDVLV